MPSISPASAAHSAGQPVDPPAEVEWVGAGVWDRPEPTLSPQGELALQTIKAIQTFPDAELREVQDWCAQRRDVDGHDAEVLQGVIGAILGARCLF